MLNGNEKIDVKNLALIASVFIAGTCSIIYELLVSTISSYLLGDSIKQFSIIIGVYLFAMGVGSYLSRYVASEKLLERFLLIELLLGLLGGISVPLLYFIFTTPADFQWFVIFLIFLIGVLTGLEVPLLSRLLENYYQLRFNLSNVLSLDYFGALLATLLFPFFFLPIFGTFQSSLIFGLINMNIAILVLFAFKNDISPRTLKRFKIRTLLASSLLIGLLLSSGYLLKKWDNTIYSGRVVYSKQSNYQKIIVTKKKDEIRLYLNGNLQFSSTDEFRYHESLVHLPMSIVTGGNILILGGGDGLVAKELLKYDNVNNITLVDLDPEVTAICKQNHYLVKANENSLINKKITVLHQDAFVFLQNSKIQFDLIIADLPDPNNVSLSRLYSSVFYRMVLGSLKESGLFVTQATSPYFTTESYWCIANTILNSGFKHITPYHTYVPSFGDWGFLLASNKKLQTSDFHVSVDTEYLTNNTIQQLLHFPKDITHRGNSVNTLDRPILLDLYLKEWKKWND